MKIQLLPKSLLMLTLGTLALPLIVLFYPQTTASAQGGYSTGALTVVDSTGKAKATCPLIWSAEGMRALAGEPLQVGITLRRFPIGQHRRLAPGQVGLHCERGSEQVQQLPGDVDV